MGKIIPIVITIIILALGAKAKAEVAKQEAINLVLNQVLVNNIGEVDVYISNNIVTAQNGVPLFNDGFLNCPYSKNWVFFVDDMVFANWYHPCRYIFVNADSIEYQIVNQNIHPENYENDYELISSVPRPQSLPLPKNSTKGSSRIIESSEPNPNLYAVIINGSDMDRYWRDISAIYCTLINNYGYTKENIFVHYVEGTSFMGEDLDGDDIHDDIDYDAYKTTIERTLRNLSGEWNNDPNVPELDPEDQLFVFIDDHGNGDGQGHSWVVLPGPDLHDYELAEFVEDIKCAQMIFVMEPCYSGGFVDDLSDFVTYNVQCDHRVIHTACEEDEVSIAEIWISNLKYDEFVFYWTAAVRGFYPVIDEPWEEGESTGSFPFENYFGPGVHPPDYDPDTNGDGKVQMEETFDYSNNWDTWSPDGYFNRYPPYTYIENPIGRHIIGFQEDLLGLAGISGEVVNSQTVSGNYLLGGDLTISTNIVLDIDPGSRFTLAEESKINSYGTLIAEGESDNQIVFTSQSSSNAHIVRFYNSTSAASSLEYCKFENAMRGIYIDDSDIDVSNCEITGCYYGIYNNYASPTLHDNDISSCVYGIYNYWSNGSIINNELNCISCGIYNYRSSPGIKQNEIYGGGTFGIRCNSYSSPQMAGYRYPGYNYVHDHELAGLYAESYSNPFMGSHYCVMPGNNSFVDNDAAQVIAQSHCSILAEDNWWGSATPSSGWFSGDVDYIPYLTSPPEMRILRSPEEEVFDLAFKDDSGLSDGLKGGSAMPFYNPGWNLRQKTRFAHALIYNGDPESALIICKDIIAQHPDSSLTFFALDLVWQASRAINNTTGNGLQDFIEYLKLLSGKRLNKLLYGSAELLLAGFERENGLARIDTVFNRYRQTYLAETALFQKFMFYFNDKEDSVLARSVVDEMDRLFPGSPLTLQAHHLLGDPINAWCLVIT